MTDPPISSSEPRRLPEEPLSVESGLEHVPSAIVGRVARQGAWNMLAYGVQAGAALVINVVVGRRLGPDHFGEYSYYVWIVRTLAWLMVMGIPPALGRTISEFEGSGDKLGVRAAYRFAFRTMALAMPVLFLATSMWVGTKSGSLVIAVSMGMAAVFLSLVWGFEQTLGGLRRYKQIARVAIVVAASQLISIFFVAKFDPSLTSFLILYGAVAIFTLMCWGAGTHLSMRNVAKRVFAREERKPFLRLAFAMSAVTISDTFLWGRPEIYFLERYADQRQVGLYAAALVLWTLTVYPPWVASRVLTPEFAWLRGGGRNDALERSFSAVCTYISLISLPLGIGGAMMAADLLLVAYGPSYLGASVAASVLLAGSSFAAIMGPASSAALTGPKPGFAAKVSFSMAMANLGLDFALIPAFGLLGAALATVLSQSVAVLIIMLYVKKTMGLRYPFGKIIKIAAASFVSVGIARYAVAGLSNRILALVLVALISLGLYAASVLVLRVITLEDIRRVTQRRS